MIRADKIIPNDANEATVLGWYQNIMQQDMEAFADLWADDAVQDMPFATHLNHEVVEPKWEGKEKILSYYNRAIPGRRDHVFEIENFHRTADPDVIFVESRGCSTVAASGKVYDQRYINKFRLRNGKIVLNREYFNPMIFQEVFGG